MDLTTYQTIVDYGRCLKITGMLNEKMYSDFMDAWQKQDKSNKDFLYVVLLSSGGGSSHWSNSLYNVLNSICEAHKVVLVCNGHVASAAISIMMAVPIRNRYAFQSTSFYLHRARWNHQAKLQGGPDETTYVVAEAIASNNLFRSEIKSYYKLIADNTAMTTQGVKKLEENPRFIGTKKAIKLGLIHSILSK